MKRFKGITLIAATLLMSAVFLLPAATAHAQSSAALSITPKKTYLVAPGKSVDDTLIIRNLDTTSALDLTLRVVDFTFTDNGGTPKLFLDENAAQTTWSLKPFMTVPEFVSIPAGGTKTVKMRVAIPAGHGAGSYYSAIVYSSGAPTGGGNVGLSASGVTLVFTQIPGQVTESLTLKQFGAYDSTAQGGTVSGYQFIIDKQPTTIGYTLQNTGNVTESPAGSITLKDIFGRETKITDVNPSGSLALIGQTRTYAACIKLASQEVNFRGGTTTASTCVNPGLWPGYYHATLDLFYGQNGNLTREVTGGASFWYLPLWFVITFLVVLAAIVVVIWRLYVNIRRKLTGVQSRRALRRRR